MGRGYVCLGYRFTALGHPLEAVIPDTYVIDPRS